jgi:hypothetical protein
MVEVLEKRRMVTKLHLTQKTIDELEPLAKADGVSQAEWEKWLKDFVEIIKSEEVNSEATTDLPSTTTDP